MPLTDVAGGAGHLRVDAWWILRSLVGGGAQQLRSCFLLIMKELVSC